MGVVGAQDFWVVGSRFYYQRDDSDVLIDLGTIQSANPSITIEKLELKDPDGGVKKTVDESITEITEEYEVVTNNLNAENRALLFLANSPTSFTQAAENKRVSHSAVVGKAFKIHNDDVDETWLYGLSAIAGIYDDLAELSTDAFTAINVATKTITTSTDLSGDLSDGDTIIIETTGLADVKNAGTYTVASATTTTVTVKESFAGANEAAITGSMIFAATGDTGTIYAKGTDWDIISVDRGVVKMIDGGAFAADADIVVSFGTAALTGSRVLNPQSAKGEVTGKAAIIYSRGNFEQETVREARVSITPSSTNFTGDDYSDITLTVKVLSDLTAEDVAGRMLDFKGNLPSTS